MANYDQRSPLDFRFGQLSGGVTSLDTTLTSASFATLPSDLSVTKYMPLTLADDSTGVFETVWITGHASGSSAVTVIRAREGTTARAWAQGAAWRCAPTVRDGLSTLTRAALPSDAHLGMRAILTDEGQVVEKGPSGWMTPFGSGAARRSLWNASGVSLPNDTEVVLSALASNTYTTSPATQVGGAYYLNKGGYWHLRLGSFVDTGDAHSLALGFRWAAGTPTPTPWPGDEVQKGYAPGGYHAAGAIQITTAWLGYVTAAQAAFGIWCFARSIVNPAATIGGYFQFTAEYLGG